MLFKYQVINQTGSEESGAIDAISIDVAISSLQRRGYIISSIKPAESGTFFQNVLSMFESVSNKEIVMLSNQISILFNSHVSALRIFRLLSEGSESPILQRRLKDVADDIQGGASLSNAMSKHPTIFSDFYVNMVKAGEESGKLTETFSYLAAYLERSYELISKTKNALVYPAFVVVSFVSVMTLMMVLVVPKLSAILIDSGQPIPAYTQAVIAISNFVRSYGIFFLVFILITGVLLWKLGFPGGRKSFSAIKLHTPFFGRLFIKTYLSRISDNLQTMLVNGVPMLRAIEITANVVGDDTYKAIMYDVAEKVKAGSSLSEAMSHRELIPNIMVQMVKVGEETGELSIILSTLSKFYKHEADATVDTLVGLIEPIMIVLLAVGVGTLLASILIPIYNITANIS